MSGGRRPVSCRHETEERDSAMTRAFLIARQRKGGKVRTVVGEVRHALQAASWKVDWVIVTRKRDLTRKTARAVKEGCDVVVIVGGDGAALLDGASRLPG